ncbi:MAG: lamin tail domain-containing protein, partial [Planctomycetota bacterium]
ATVGGIQFQELSGSNVIGPGLGATLDGNIFWDTPLVFEAIHPDTNLQVRRSIVTEDLVDSGFRNLSVDPLLVDPARGDFRLREGSPAFFQGPNDSDIGAEQRPRYKAATAESLRITELHYNPVGGETVNPTCEVPADGDWFEFIELLNPSGETIDLSYVTFTDGIEFAFPWGSTLGPGERSVLVKDRGVFESRYGTGINIGGEYTSKFANSGEHVELRAADGSVIADFTYGDGNEPGWPVLPDGDGPSLEIIDVNGDYNDPTNWRTGVNPGGTPGEQMLGPFVATSDHQYETDDSIEISFSEPIDVATITDHTEFILTNLTTGNTLSASEYLLSSLTTTEATISFAAPTIAADGNWRITMAAGAFSNAAGDPSVTPYEFDFYILKGDYNRNRVVDAADFAVWRDTLGSTSHLRANGDNLGASQGIIDDADRLVWLANFGNAVDDPSGNSGAGDGRLNGPVQWNGQRHSDSPAPIRTAIATPTVQTVSLNAAEPRELVKRRSAIQRVFATWE